MSNTRKRSLDHAKKTQRPMGEDKVIANQLFEKIWIIDGSTFIRSVIV